MRGNISIKGIILIVIFIVLAVLVVLWYSGILFYTAAYSNVYNPSKWSGDTVSEGSAFKIVDKQLTGNTFSVVLGDKTGSQITITAIDITGDIIGSASELSVMIYAGEQTAIQTVSLTAPTTAGSSYKFTVTTTYTATGGLANQKDVAQYNIKAV